MNLREKIIELSNELGFFKVGFTAAVPLEEEYRNYSSWIESGKNATMAWMENNSEKRQDVRIILPEAKSVIVFAHNYNTGHKHNEANHLGKISRYAWGNDYHEVLLNKLNKIVELITSAHPESKNKVYVDTGPILEKVWAERAGIGWQGKNSLILTKEYGSFFFLGIIISSLVFEFDSPIKELCGKCTICLNLCPTKAIVTPKIIDSGKCISYWTIEAKPDLEIPSEINRKQNNWLFGCDICQDVCPWNRRLNNFSTDSDFIPRNNEAELDINETLNMTDDEFKSRFKGSTVRRLKLDGLKRNALSIIKSQNNRLIS